MTFRKRSNRSTSRLLGAAMMGMLLALGACASHHPATQPTTRTYDLPKEHATIDYWMKQPARASAHAGDFKVMWQACRRVLFDELFTLDQTDYRQGTMTTLPMISKQWFEPWRHDAGTAHDVLLSSLQTIRRYVRIEIRQAEDGSYIATPYVIVEKESRRERRLTSYVQYGQAFEPPQGGPDITDNKPNDNPSQYWYVIGRDNTMEKQLAKEIDQHAHDIDPHAAETH